MSTGTKAFYLPPVDALHGDLGMVSDADLVLIFSKSGETDELLQLLPPIRRTAQCVLHAGRPGCRDRAARQPRRAPL